MEDLVAPGVDGQHLIDGRRERAESRIRSNSQIDPAIRVRVLDRTHELGNPCGHAAVSLTIADEEGSSILGEQERTVQS